MICLGQCGIFFETRVHLVPKISVTMKLTILAVVACFTVASAQFWDDDFGDRFGDFGDNLWDRTDDMYDDWGYSPYRWNSFRPWGGWNRWGWGRRHYRPQYYHKPRRHYGYNQGYNPGYSNYGQLMSNMYLYNKIFDWFVWVNSIAVITCRISD